MFKKFLPLFYFSLIYIANIAHNWFDDTEPAFIGDTSHLHNWILFNYKPMTNAWNVEYLSWWVIIPILITLGINSMIKQIDEFLQKKIGERIPKIYRIEWTIFKVFIILNSLTYFLIFKDGDPYYWIFWITSAFAAHLWCKKEDKITSNV